MSPDPAAPDGAPDGGRPTEPTDPTVLDRTALARSLAGELGRIRIDDGEEVPADAKLAYYRASGGDVAVAALRLRETLAWRREVDIDGAMDDPAWRERERSCRRLLKYDYLGADKHGRPVMVERVGAWNVPDVLAAAGEDPDAFLRLHCMACETLLTMDRPPDALDGRGQVVIMDCLGLAPRHLDPRLARAFGRLAGNDAAHYPDTLAHVFVVNAPYLFSALARLIAPFMDPDTYSKVHVSSGVPGELAECVGGECLPRELGGEREGVYPYHEDGPLSEHPVRK